MPACCHTGAHLAHTAPGQMQTPHSLSPMWLSTGQHFLNLLMVKWYLNADSEIVKGHAKMLKDYNWIVGVKWVVKG